MTKNYREIDKENTRGRKRYLERLQQTREATKEQEEALIEMSREQEVRLYDDVPTRKDQG